MLRAHSHCVSGGLFGQSTVDDSKLHRRPYNPPFSRAAVIKKEDLIREKMNSIVKVLDEACGTDQIVDISSYYRALTTDIIASFSLARTWISFTTLTKPNAFMLYGVHSGGEWHVMRRLVCVKMFFLGWSGSYRCYRLDVLRREIRGA